MKRFVLLLGLVLLTGCGPLVVEPDTDKPVGTVDGKELHCVRVSGGGCVHYIYYFPSAPKQPISNNYRSGKTSAVVVFIDNKPVSTNIVILEDPK